MARQRYDDDEDDDYDDDEDDDVRGRRIRRDDDPVESLIPYRNPRGLAAYYCGVFGLIPCLGLILGPIALILGILGVKYANRHPKARGMGHAIFGIIAGSLEILGNYCVVIWVAIAALTANKR